MGKYDLLGEYLRQQSRVEVLLTFKQIERIIAAPLPDRALKPQWWLPAATRSWTDVWRSAGFDAQLRTGRRVKFTRMH
jgi:hypothetical protein